MASYILWCVLVPTCSIHHLKHKCWAQDMRWTYKAIYHPARCNSKAIGRYSRSHMCSRCKILIYIQLSPYGLLVVCRNVFFPRIASSDHRLSVLLHVLHSVIWTAAGSLQSDYELTLSTKIYCCVWPWDGILYSWMMADTPVVSSAPWFIEVPGIPRSCWLSLRSTGTVS